MLWLPVPFTSLSTVCSTAEPKPFCWAKQHDFTSLHRILTCRATYWALVELLYEHVHRCNSTSTQYVMDHMDILFFAKSTPYSFPTLGTGKLSILVGSTKWGVVNLCTYTSRPPVNHLVSIKTWSIFSLSCRCYTNLWSISRPQIT